MTGSRPILVTVIASVVPLLFSACSTPSMVDRPQVNEVQRVAVVSVSANRGVHPMEGQSEIGALTSMASFVGGDDEEGQKEEDEAADFGGHKLVNRAVSIFTEELDQVNGWQAVPPEQFVDSAAYRSFADDMEQMAEEQLGGAMKLLGAANTIQARGMPLVPGPTPEATKRMAELADDLNVDGVVTVFLDVAYDSSVSVGGTGTAAATVGADVSVINADGEVAVSTNKYQDADARFREASDETTGMVAGEIVYNKEVEQMFLDSISKTAAKVRQTINQDLEKSAS